MCTQLIVALLITTSATCSFGQIDITDREEVERLVKKQSFKGYEYISFKPMSQDSTQSYWQLGDLNRDNITDYLIKGTSTLSNREDTVVIKESIVLLGGKKHFTNIHLYSSYFNSWDGNELLNAAINKIGDRDFILISYTKYNAKDHSKTSLCDTLTILNGRVMLHSDNPSTDVINSIRLITNNCYGECPVYDITLRNSLQVDYDGIEFVSKKGTYKLKMQRNDWTFISQLLNNIRFKDLEAEYSVHYTDNQTGYLTIGYNYDSQKKIEDYGLMGTYGLTLLYDYIHELINSF